MNENLGLMFISLVLVASTIQLGVPVEAFTNQQHRSFAQAPRPFSRQCDGDLTICRAVSAASTTTEEIPLLGEVRSVPEFRKVINEQEALTKDQRLVLIEQAEILMGDLYTHLPLKKAMHAIDPLQRLRLLKQHLEDVTMSTTEFHAALLDIFTELRDLHTNYSLPGPFGGIAFLGIAVEKYYEGGVPKYMVSKVAEHLVADNEKLKPGVEITHWNGMPMELAVARNADKEAGSNLGARLARGLENMALRFLRASLPPDEDWVTLTYLDGDSGEPQETRLDWKIYDSGSEILEGSADPEAVVDMLTRKTPLRYDVAVDERAERFRRARKLLFNPSAVEEEERVKKQYKGEVPSSTDALKLANIIPTSRPDEITARIVETDSGTFGYLRLWTFFMRDGVPGLIAFLEEMRRLLLSGELPDSGLILDVRGNGGGFVIASEYLLQYFTPKQITPEPSQFIATARSLELVRAVPAMADWEESLERAVSTGSLHSAGIPLSPAEFINMEGQLYFGPVVLLTDAYCYSACDMFAAGFQDHEIGTVLGADMSTGAGGANVLGQADLLRDWKDGPLEELPGGAGMRVSIRRTLRVGKNSGQILEDLGVQPDVLHEMTRADLLEGNRDLLNKAGEILAKGTPRKIDAELSTSFFRQSQLKLATEGMDSVDIFLNDRPVTETVELDEDGTTNVDVPKPDRDDVLRVKGYSNGEFVANKIVSEE